MDMDMDMDADADADSDSDILESLLKEFICPLCGEYFKDPMITSCGHDFCRACIIRHWERCRDSFPCPMCGAERPEIRLRPNRQLRNAAEPAQSLAAEARRSQVEPPEPWARAGRADRAAQHLCTREEFFFGWSCERETCLEPLPFGFPQPCLIEGPPSVCVICRGLLQHWSNIFLPIQNAAQQYQPFCRPHKKHPDALKASLRPANVTLDPATAHPDLVLSEDGKRVRRAGTQQPLPDTPERFDPMRCVLGREGFTSGRHYWEVEVEVGDEQYWGVGVARESVSRKGGISLCPKGGIWAVRWWGGQFQALTDPETPLPLRPPSRIRVCLDCDQKQVTFIDAGTKAPIFTFPPGSLPREIIRPWIWVEWGTDTELRLSPLQQPLWPHTPQSV